MACSLLWKRSLRSPEPIPCTGVARGPWGLRGHRARAGLALALAACGAGAPPQLPVAAPTPYTATSAAPGTAPAAPLLSDRALGRTGLACTDCHPSGPPSDPPSGAADDRRPPAPALGGGSGDRPLWHGATRDPVVAANLCVERYLARPALTGEPLGRLAAELLALPEVPLRPPSDARVPPPADLPEGDVARGRALYDRACRGCHEGGPGGRVWGRAWARGALAATIRGTDRPLHPGTLMPPFGIAVLSDAELADLTTAVAEAAVDAM